MSMSMCEYKIQGPVHNCINNAKICKYLANTEDKDMCDTYKKDLIRRQGKGCHVGLGDRILAALAVLPQSF